MTVLILLSKVFYSYGKIESSTKMDTFLNHFN